jgi:RHS repeat-associated protein
VLVGRWQVDQTMPDLELQTTWGEQQGVGGPSVSGLDSLTHDAWGRVTAITHRKNGALLTSATYAFDPDGNITANAETRVFDAATTRLTQRAGTSYRYDRAGNLDSVTSGSPAWKYVYDALDRLIEVRQNGTLIARYAYDVLGRRIVKRVYSGANAGYLRMIYRGGEIIAEADTNGALTFGYTRGLETDNLIAIRRYTDGTHYYVVHDPLGSVRGLSKRDGTWIASWRYGIYGAVIDSAGSAPFSVRYRWTGREYDAETGFYFFRSRFYDPAAQRFVQEDPIGFAGGANLYAYGDGNPTNGRDPNGMSKSQLFYDLESLQARQLASMESLNPGGSPCYVDGVTMTGMICGAMADWANWNWIHSGAGVVSEVPDQWTTIVEQQWQGVMNSFNAALPDVEIVIGEPMVEVVDGDRKYIAPIEWSQGVFILDLTDQNGVLHLWELHNARFILEGRVDVRADGAYATYGVFGWDEAIPLGNNVDHLGRPGSLYIRSTVRIIGRTRYGRFTQAGPAFGWEYGP